jgi:L-asparaginase / beta-aspartyl-peptidase
MILLASSEGQSAFAPAVPILETGGSVIDALEAAIRAVELAGSPSVGLSGEPNVLGRHELDAGIMEGRTQKSGAVAALQGCRHPISVARKVMELLPHELLVGRGAALFAKETGLLDDLDALTGDIGNLGPHFGGAPIWEKATEALRRYENHDTVIVLGIDHSGAIAAGTSTSGLAGKYPGRVGDSPIAGAGFYAMNGVGACACTGVGEMTIRCSTARMTIEHMKRGASVEDAVRASLAELTDLKGGLLGGVTVHAIDAAGGHFVGAVRGKPRTYYLWSGDGSVQTLSGGVI